MDRPTYDQIAAALGTLPERLHRRGALHLALPVTDTVELDVTVERSRWHWRDASRVATDDPVADALALTAAVGPHEDYSDPARRRTWVRLRRSGTRTVAFGLDLAAGRTVSFAPSVPPAAIDAVLAVALSDPLATAPMVVAAPLGRPVLVEGDAATWVVHATRTDAPLRGRRVLDAAQTAAAVATELGAVAWDLADASRLHCVLADAAAVALDVADGRAGVFAPITSVRATPVPATPAPHGWVPVGTTDGHLVVEHRQSGLRARLLAPPPA